MGKGKRPLLESSASKKGRKIESQAKMYSVSRNGVQCDYIRTLS